MAVSHVPNPTTQEGSEAAAAAAPAKCSNSSHNHVLMSAQAASEVLTQLEALLPGLRAQAGRHP
jgi:hypothetical protein